jgi:hypothetical protein
MVRTARAHLAQALPRTSRRREGVTRPCLRFRIVDSDHPIRYLVLYSSLNLWRRKHEKYTAHAQKKKILMGRAIHAPMASWARYSPSLAVSALDTKSMGRAGGAGGGDGGDGDIAHAARRIRCRTYLLLGWAPSRRVHTGTAPRAKLPSLYFASAIGLLPPQTQHRD